MVNVHTRLVDLVKNISKDIRDYECMAEGEVPGSPESCSWLGKADGRRAVQDDLRYLINDIEADQPVAAEPEPTDAEARIEGYHDGARDVTSELEDRLTRAHTALLERMRASDEQDGLAGRDRSPQTIRISGKALGVEQALDYVEEIARRSKPLPTDARMLADYCEEPPLVPFKRFAGREHDREHEPNIGITGVAASRLGESGPQPSPEEFRRHRARHIITTAMDRWPGYGDAAWYLQGVATALGVLHEVEDQS